MWTEDQVSELRAFAASHNGAFNTHLEEIARHFGKSVPAVKTKASRLGLYKTHGKLWLDSEDVVLVSLAGKESPGRIAHRLGRSESGVRSRLKTLGLEASTIDGYLPLAEISRILGVSLEWVRFRCNLNLIKREEDGRIKVSSLRDFMLKYPRELENKNLDIVTVIMVVGGQL